MTAPIAIPGQHLGSLADYSPGAGTHQAAQQIVASILGAISIAPGAPPTISVSSTSTSTSTPRGPPTGTVLPAVDAEVLARVVRIAPRQATVAILVVAGHVCSDEFQGVIRVEDVRATEKDKVRIQASFRPGDIVRAKVISLGDQLNYYLSTARNELGVVMAVSEAGNQMYPISWREFRDPVTGVGEGRKVAKPF